MQPIASRCVPAALLHALRSQRPCASDRDMLFANELQLRCHAMLMENQSGGYEIRVASSKYSFKSALKARDITLIRGISPERGIVNVFEGMTDFLSLLVMMNCSNLAGDSLIMHSLSSYQRAADCIHAKGYQVINTFLDNDTPGREGTERLKNEFGEKVTSQSPMFAGYKDLNDALRANTTSLQSAIKR